MVSKGNQNLLINLGIVVLAIVIIYVVIIRNPNALNWLKGPGKKTGAVQVGSNTATGWNVYQKTGESSTSPEHRVDQEIGCSGCDALSQRDNHTVTATNYEATAIIQLQPNDTCNCGDEFDVKLLGPEHSNGGYCCWWVFGILPNGGIYTGGEGLHPKTSSKNEGDGSGILKSNVGPLSKAGIKAVTWDNGDGTRHVEGWVDITGAGTSWERVVDDDITEWGHNEEATSLFCNLSVCLSFFS